MIWITIFLVVLLLMGMPIGFSFILASVLGYFVVTDAPIQTAALGLFSRLDNFLLLAVPFFIFAGTLMGKGASAKKLINFIEIFSGHIPGGLLVATVISCAFFAGISGSSVADVVAIGALMYPILKEKFDPDFSLAVIAASGTLGVIIPPSIPMVIYSMMANASIAALFLTGFIPGLLLSGFFILYIIYYSKKRKYITVSEKFSGGKVLRQFVDSFFALITPGIILGGIYSGIFTPTESAVVASIYVILIEVFVYRSVTLEMIFSTFVETGISTGLVLIILVGALIFGDVLMIERIPFKMADLAVTYLKSPFLFMIIMNILMLFMGCFIDMLSIIMILTPIFMPMILGFNIDPVHFGIIATVNTSAGLLTPPFGLNVFVAGAAFGVPIEKIFKAVFPFLVIYFIVILMVTYLSDLILFLPRIFGFVH